MSNRINIHELMLKGIRAAATQGNDAEKKKAGNLRGGSSGILLPDGNVAGECHRKTYARLKGSPTLHSEIYDTPQLEADEVKQLMFSAGNLNEDAWYSWLNLSGYEGKILREEEIPSMWKTENGTKVTGRPDIVLCDATGKPVEGIELKLMCSFWTFRSVVLEDEPKFPHLVQSAQYSMALDIPYQLWYNSQMNYTGPDFAMNIVPKYGTPGSEKLEYTYGRRDRNGVYKTGKRAGQAKYKFTKIQVPEADRGLPQAELEAKYGVTSGEFKNTRPALKGFELTWLDDTLHYRDAAKPDSQLRETDITKDGIRKYYEMISTMEERKELGPRPLTLKPDGSSMNYSSCDYCPFSKTCDKYEAGKLDFDGWSEDVLADT